MRPTCNDLGQERPWYTRSVRRSGVALATATIAVVFSIAGVTPAYAEAMNRAALAMRAIDEAGELQ